MSHSLNCPDDWTARRRAQDDADFDRGDMYRRPYDCDEANDVYRREYLHRQEEAEEERRAERRREERRQEERWAEEQAYEEARQRAEEEAYLTAQYEEQQRGM